MPRMGWPSFTSRTSPTKLASAPTSARPRVSDSSSRPTSKSPDWTRTLSMRPLPAGDGRKERDLVAGLEWRRGMGHLLVHRDAPLFRRGEGLGPARVPRAQVLHQGGDGWRPGGKGDLLPRTAEAFAQAREVEQGHHALAHQAGAIEPQVLNDEARHRLGIAHVDLGKERIQRLVGCGSPHRRVAGTTERQVRKPAVHLTPR